MLIVETDDFFKTVKEKGMSFDQWMGKIEKIESKEKVLKYFKESEFISKKYTPQLKELTYKQYLVAIAADWCGDCQRNVPILEHICKISNLLEFILLKKEDNLDLLLKSNGGEKIPYVMFYSRDGYFVTNWIERSYESYKFTASTFRKFRYEKNEELFKFYSEAYEKQKTSMIQSTANEIIHMILKVNAVQGASTRINKAL